MTDYQTFTTKDTSVEERRKLNIGDIWNNGAHCLKCDEYIRSKNRHDYNTCKCGNISVDGGSWYIRRSFRTSEYEEYIEYYSDVKQLELQY